jgi:Putative Ig domain
MKRNLFAVLVLSATALSGCGGGEKVTNCSFTGAGTTSFSATAVVGQFFSRQFVNFGAVPANCQLSWSDGAIRSTLPPGLSISTSTGFVSGVPTAPTIATQSTLTASIRSTDGGSGDIRVFTITWRISSN